MRTRGAVEDLVVVDLDDPDEVERRGPGAQRVHFEDHYAELPFGLGTVARRLEPDPWYTRPGVLLWIAIALVGLLALAGSDDDTSGAPSRPETQAVSPLTVATGVRLALYHVGSWIELDVDGRTLRPIPPRSLPPELAALVDQASDLGRLPPRTARLPPTFEGQTACISSATGELAVRMAAPDQCQLPEQPPPAFGWLSTWSRGGRFVFVASGPDLLVIDAVEDGFVRRVDVELPPFEAVAVL
jgi:hypothetical protein